MHVMWVCFSSEKMLIDPIFHQYMAEFPREKEECFFLIDEIINSHLLDLERSTREKSIVELNLPMPWYTID